MTKFLAGSLAWWQNDSGWTYDQEVTIFIPGHDVASSGAFTTGCI